MVVYMDPLGLKTDGRARGSKLAAELSPDLILEAFRASDFGV